MIALSLLLACAPELHRIPDGAQVDLPADHGPHDDAQTEWWHVHGQLEDLATGETLDWFAGFVVQRTTHDRVAGIPVSLFMDRFHTAYVQIVTEDGAWTSDRQGFPDVWAAGFHGDGLELHHDDWRIAWEHGALVLQVDAGPHALDLKLLPTEPALTPGVGGRVEIPPGSPHLWMQQERMRVEGRWHQRRQTRWVTGWGFYKHQWGRLYDEGVDGFQWFSMDLDEQHSLSIGWILRGRTGGMPGSVAWLGRRDGRAVHIPTEMLLITPTRTWKSRRSGAEWPVAWNILGPGLSLEVEARRDELELYAFPAAMHLGPARVRGSFRGEPVDGPAYIEQVGADMPKLRHLFSSGAPR